MAVSDPGSDAQLEIGHVLFMDIVGYSKLLLDEQRERQQELTQLVRNTQQVRLAEEGGKLIRIPTGDGMALVFFNTPEAPIRCAVELASALKSHPEIPLRMGIHSGPVNEIQDVNDRANIAGAGINTAQRVMDCGDAGHILLSKRAADDMAQSRHWRPFLHDLGECAVKHGAAVFVVNLYTDEVGNAEPPQKFKQLESERVAASAKDRSLVRKRILTGSALLLAGVIAAGVWWFRQPNEVPSDKSIAVLPFENYSDDKENAFFADGIQDDILTSLAHIENLRVISRTSVMSYRGTKESHNLRKISKELNVSNVLEGSVRREKNRIVVNVQLIDAPHDRHLWAKRYERTLDDALGLQGELAHEIADALRVTLSADEKAQVERKPTSNPEAYLVYLRANQIERNPDTLLEDYKRAENLYQQAITLDPQFALAHARLAATCAQLYHYYDPTEPYRKKAQEEAEIALRLQPNLAEGHLARGQCVYWFDLDYDAALREFEIVRQISPNNTEVAGLTAAIQRRRGHWDEAVRGYERALARDPQNANIARNLVFTYTGMRRWSEASVTAQKMRAMAPTSLVARIQTGYIDFWWKGDTHLLKSLVDEVPPNIDPDGAITATRWEVAMMQRDFAGALKILDSVPVTEVSYTNNAPTPKAFLAGCTLLALGRVAEAQKNFELARPVFENAVKEAPASAERHAILGWFYAFAGRKDDAIREGRKAVELKPESEDALDGALLNSYLALIYARVGENDLAFPLLERLLKIPGPVDSTNNSITVNDLKYRWEWDPIRNDPRFQKLLQQTP